MVTGHFSLFASFNLSACPEGPFRFLRAHLRTSGGPSATLPQSGRIPGPFYWLTLQDSEESFHLKDKHCHGVNLQLTSQAGRNGLQITYVTKESSPEYIKNSVQLNRKETNSPAETGAKDFTKEDTCVASKRRRKMVNRQWLGGNLFLPKSLWNRYVSSQMLS